MRIIIALDIIGGKCVRLTKGDYSTKKIYSEDPLEVAKQVEDHGIEFIHLVDLDGAKQRKVINDKILRNITSKTALKVDFGGGLRSEKDIDLAFDCGAVQVTCGSVVLADPEMFLGWLGKYGNEKIILGADAMNRKISVEGWSENSGTDIISFIGHYLSKGIKYAICTDIEKDGMLQGPSVDLYKEILELPRINLIASGGITTTEDIKKLKEIGCEGAIIGKALYEGMLNLKEISWLC